MLYICLLLLLWRPDSWEKLLLLLLPLPPAMPLLSLAVPILTAAHFYTRRSNVELCSLEHLINRLSLRQMAQKRNEKKRQDRHQRFTFPSLDSVQRQSSV